MCGDQPARMIGRGVGGAVAAAGDAITALAKSSRCALGHAVEWALMLWVDRDAAGCRQPGQATGTVALPQNLLVFTTGLAVLCTLLGAGRIVDHEQKATQLRDLGCYLTNLCAGLGAAVGAASVLISGRDQMGVVVHHLRER